MSLQQEVFVIPQLWSRHLALLGAWSDSAFAATQECLKLHFATWGKRSETSALEFPFVNLCQPHAVFTLQEQWTIPNFEHLVDYQSACTQILSETGQRMAEAWADYEVLNPSGLPSTNTVQWQIPGWDFSFTSVTASAAAVETSAAEEIQEQQQTHAEAVAAIPDARPALQISAEAEAAAEADTEAETDAEDSPLQAEFAEMAQQQQAADAAAAVVAKARASFPQAPRISASKTVAKSVRTTRSKPASSGKTTASPAKTGKAAGASALTAKKKSSKA